MNGFFATLSEAHLEELQYSSGILALVATAVVAIGLVAEYQGSKSDARTNWYPLTGGPPPYWDLERKGDWLIVIGVVFEFAFGWVAFASTSALDTQRQHEIATLNHTTANLNDEAEKLRGDNLALEILIQPREVPLDTGPRSAPLRQHKGTRVFIEIASGPCGCDPEARQLANQLTWVLPQVGWKPEPIQGAVPTNFMTEGVVIFARLVWPSLRERDLTHTPPTAREIVVNETFDAANALDKYLKHFDVLSHVEEFATTNPLTFDLPPDAIVIFVGSKPIRETIEHRKWLERMPETSRK